MGSVSATDLPGTGFSQPKYTAIMTAINDPQQHQELALRDQVGLAGFVDQFRDFAHGAMHGQVLQAHEDGHAETEAKHAEQQMPISSSLWPSIALFKKADRRKVGQLQRSLAAAGLFGGLRQRAGGH